jgi:hypothetical protein
MFVRGALAAIDNNSNLDRLQVRASWLMFFYKLFVFRPRVRMDPCSLTWLATELDLNGNKTKAVQIFIDYFF